MHIVDLIGKIAGRLHGIHELPDEVRGVELQSDMRAVPEGLEERLPTYRTGRDVRPACIGLPEDAYLVLLAQGEILLVVDLHYFVDLLRQRAPAQCAALPADTGDTEFARQLDTGGR